MGKPKVRKGNATSTAKKEIKSLQATTKIAKKAKAAAAIRSLSAQLDEDEMTSTEASNGNGVGTTANTAAKANGPARVNDLFDTTMSEGGTAPPPTVWDEDSDNNDRMDESQTRDSSDEDEEEDVNIIVNDPPNIPEGPPDTPNSAPMPNLSTPEDPNATPRAQLGALPTGDKTPTPAPSSMHPGNKTKTGQEGAPEDDNAKGRTKSGKKAKTSSQDEKNLEEVQKLLEDTAKAAQTGDFHLNFKFFTHPGTTEKAEKEGSSASKLFKKHRIEWSPVMADGLDGELLHHASNPLNMMSTNLVDECVKASSKGAHNLGRSSHILIEKGFKWMFKLMTYKIPKEDQTAWVTHAVRSALSTAGVPLSSTLATIDLCEDAKKSPHQWTLISFTEEGYNVFKGMRLLFDPRSEMAVLIRPWTMEPPRDPVFSIGAVVTKTDNERDAAEARQSLEETISKMVEESGVVVTHTAMALPPKNATTVKPVNVHLKIKEDADLIFFSPRNFAGLRIRTPMGTRVTTCQFGRLCSTCGSDSHVEKKKCPWESYKIGDNGINLDVAPGLTPGRTPEVKKSAPGKRKRDADDESDEEGAEKANALPVMRDARPKAPAKKRQKNDDPKEKGRATESEVVIVE